MLHMDHTLSGVQKRLRKQGQQTGNFLKHGDIITGTVFSVDIHRTNNGNQEAVIRQLAEQSFTLQLALTVGIVRLQRCFGGNDISLGKSLAHAINRCGTQKQKPLDSLRFRLHGKFIGQAGIHLMVELGIRNILTVNDGSGKDHGIKPGKVHLLPPVIPNADGADLAVRLLIADKFSDILSNIAVFSRNQ